MNVCGIVTEYNPMHLGHEYQINQAKEITHADGTILIMSGNFVQRGEPALIDKYSRAKAAVKTGIDLVIELPTYFATASAEYFSTYALRLLNETGIVTHLNFGSESGEIEDLKAIADILYDEPLGYSVLLNDFLKEGLSYPKAREKALILFNNNHNIMDPSLLSAIETPNNILGIEYIKAIKRMNSTIKPTTIKRIGATYHDDNSEVAIPSATSIRKHLLDSNNLEDLKIKVPKASYEVISKTIQQGTAPIFVQDIYHQLKHQLLVASPSSIASIMDVSEGMENRILKALDTTHDYDSFMEALLTKRYTKTRIARALLHIYLNHTKEKFNQYYKDMSPYLKVLAMNSNGQKLIKAIKKANEDLPIIVNNRQGYKLLDPLQKECYLADLNSNRLYNHLINAKYGTVVKNEYQQQIIPI